MKRSRTVLLLLFSTAFAVAGEAAASADAPPGMPLGLDQAVSRALEHSRMLAAAHADLGAAEAAEGQARASLLPRVTLSEEGLRTDNPTLVFSNKLGQERFAAADFELQRLNQPDALTNFRTRLSLELPLWAGGALRHQIRAAGEQRIAAAEQLDRTLQEVAHQVTNAYLTAVAAEQQRRVTLEVEKTVAAHLKLVRDLFEAGQVVESDLLRIQVRESEVQEQVIRARAAVEVAHAALNLAMGEPQETAWALDHSIQGEAAPAEENLGQLLAAARAQRPDLAAVRAGVEAARQGHSAARAGARPNLFAGAFAEANGEDPASFDGDNWGAQLGVRWNLFDGLATRRAVERAGHQVEAAEHRAALYEQAIALEVRSAFHETRAAAQQREQAERAVAWAERSLTIVEDRYREGLATLVELLEAETTLAEARARRVTARAELLRAASALDLAVGRVAATPPSPTETTP